MGLFSKKISKTLLEKNPHLAQIDKETKKGKYNNRKVLDSTGEEKDSKLEALFCDLLRRYKIEFETQKKFDLMDDFINPNEPVKLSKATGRPRNRKAIRGISVSVDVYVKDYLGYETIIDPKGKATEASILRFKLLEKRFVEEGRKYQVIFPRTESDVRSCAVRMSKGLPIIDAYKKPY
jgi:hypothetical protein